MPDRPDKPAPSDSMLLRFSLYGFLKNQRYYEPFLFLAFRDKGLSFAMIGMLIGFREICTNLLEIPTGAIADVAGRRRSMIASFVAYIGAFAVFAFSTAVWQLFAAMFLFSIGEAFRTGTHKAIIFDWLAHQGRQRDRVRVYGFTRSWSQIGSAVCMPLATALALVLGSYEWLFLACIIPYAANIVNFLTYPAYLDGPRSAGGGIGKVVATMLAALRKSVGRGPLRRLFVESMGFEGLHRAGKDWLQIVLKQAAPALPLLLWMNDSRRTDLLVGSVYFLLYLLSSFASRRAHALVDRAGSEARAARWLWAMNLACFAAMAAGMALQLSFLAVAAFVALAVVQNCWRPILISRFADRVDPPAMATTLSIESQGKTLATACLAPLLGWTFDLMPAGCEFLPLPLLGLAVATVMLATSRRREPKA